MGDMADLAIQEGLDQYWENCGDLDEWTVQELGLFGAGKDHWHFPAELIGHTDKAWLVTLKNGKRAWFPKSCCSYEGTHMHAPDWLMRIKAFNDEI